MPKSGKSHVAADLPAKGKLLADLSALSAEDRARAGITDAMVKAQAEAAKPKGIQMVKGPWQASEDHDVVTQVRVIDHDQNRVLFSGTESEYAAFQKALRRGEG